MANTTLTGFPAIASVAAEDLLAVVDDPSGSAALRKATITQLETHLDGTVTDRLSGIASIVAADEIFVIDDVAGAKTPTTATFTQVAAHLDDTVTDRLSGIASIAAGDEIFVVDNPAGAKTPTTATFTQVTTLLDGTLAGKKSMWIPVSEMVAATTSGPALAQIETTTNKVNVPVFDFDGAADEFAAFNKMLGEAWNLGTVTFRAVYTCAATDADSVIWGLQGVSITDGVALDTAYGTGVTVSDALQSGADKTYITAESTAVTIDGTPADNEPIFFRVYRDADTDVATEDARLIGIKLYYTENALTDA